MDILTGRLGIGEEGIYVLEDSSSEIIQNVGQRGKKIENINESLRVTEDRMRRSKIYFIGRKE